MAFFVAKNISVEKRRIFVIGLGQEKCIFIRTDAIL
jgi:hypothetical protein